MCCSLLIWQVEIYISSLCLFIGVLLNAIFEQAELHWTLVGALAYLAFGALNVFLLPFAALTGGRLQLKLAFDEQQKSIRKVVLARSGADDGSVVERQISQLSGGEWRRLGLALSLGFAELATARSVRRNGRA